jgi:hypothetical protein
VDHVLVVNRPLAVGMTALVHGVIRCVLAGIAGMAGTAGMAGVASVRLAVIRRCVQSCFQWACTVAGVHNALLWDVTLDGLD